MSEVDLSDLKIDHDPPGRSGRTPMLLLGVFFLLGGGLGVFVMYLLWPAPPPDSGKTTPGGVPAKRAGGPPPVTGESFTEGGWIEVPSYHPIVVSALIPGRVEELRVLEAAPVKKGDLLAVLYQKDLQDEVTKAEAELNVAGAALERLRAGFRKQEVEAARADLAAAAADVKLKQQVLERTKRLVDSGAVSAEDLDRDAAAHAVAVAKHATLEQDLALKEEGSRVEDIQAAEAEVGRRQALLALARNRLAYTTIRSPVDGVVLERFVTPGTTLAMDDPKIVSLYDPKDLQVRVDVRQENIGRAFVGQRVWISTDAEPGKEYAGSVIRINPLADFKKNTVQVKVKIDEPSRRLHPEMIARIRFEPRTEKNEAP